MFLTKESEMRKLLAVIALSTLSVVSHAQSRDQISQLPDEGELTLKTVLILYWKALNSGVVFTENDDVKA